MQSHKDILHAGFSNEAIEEMKKEQMESEAKFRKTLEHRANFLQDNQASTIAGGKKGEKLGDIVESGDFGIRKLPDDTQGILRISIGGGPHLPVSANYCSYRGDKGMCIDLLEQALTALKSS